MIRKRYEWKLRSRTLQLGDRTLVMGVLNVTPDSFSDGGKYSDPDRAFARAIEMEEQGVDIIDIGAESTKPGSQRISEAEELRRLIPVLKRLQGQLGVPLSVDTYKSGVAEKALEYGVEIINDPSGLTFDVQVAKAAANGDAGLIINHMRGTPDMWAKLPGIKNVAGSVITELDAAINRARRNGVDPKRIVVDPGLGFGKRREQNSELIARLLEFERLDYPLLVGPSRKQFLAQLDPERREFATAAAVAACILNGAHIVRVHDIAAILPAIQVTDAIVAAQPGPPEPEETPKEAKERRAKVARATGPDADRRVPLRPPATGPVKPDPSRPVRPSRPARPAGPDSERRPPRPPRFDRH